MNAEVINPFTDKETGKIYLIGDSFSGSKSRVEGLAENGFVRLETKPEAKPETNTKAKK